MDEDEIDLIELSDQEFASWRRQFYSDDWLQWDGKGKMLGHIPYIHYCTSEANCTHTREQ